MGLYENSLIDNQRKRFASDQMKVFLPMHRGVFSKLKEIPDDRINAKGWYYMWQKEVPGNFRQTQFASSEAGIFSDAGGAGYLVQNVTAIAHRAALRYSDHVLYTNKRAGQQEISDRTVNNMVKEHLKQLNDAMEVQYWGNKTNEVARVSAINYGTRTITCANAGNLFGCYLMRIGMRLHGFASDAVTQRVNGGGVDYLIVESINRDARTFTYRATDYQGNALPAPPLLIANGDILYRENGKDNAINGMIYEMANTGPFQGQADRTINPGTTGYTINAGSSPLSVALLRRQHSDVLFGQIDDDPIDGFSFFVSTQKDAFDALGDALQPTQQDGKELMLGRLGRSFNGINFRWHPYIARDACALHNPRKVDKGVLKEYDVESDEAIMKQSGGEIYHEFALPLAGYWNIGAEFASELGSYMYGLTTAGYSLGYAT